MTTSTIIVTSNEQFIDILSSVGTSAMGIEYESVLKHNKGKVADKKYKYDLPDEVLMISKIVPSFGGSYESSVNKQLVREGKEAEFVAGSLPWGEWVIENKVLKNGESYYIRYYKDMLNNPNKSEYVWAGSRIPLTKEELDKFNEFVKFDDSDSNQGTEKEIKPRNLGFDKIKKVNVNGMEIIFNINK